MGAAGPLWADRAGVEGWGRPVRPNGLALRAGQPAGLPATPAAIAGEI
jgi:hypothetical protein